MLVRGDRVIAGVSGGADSVCLFCVLSELRDKLGFELVAVHVNHGLRGEAADADERFVETLCERHRVPLEIFHVELELIAKNRKQSLEEAGRNVRREAFLAALRKYGANKVALAHHQNDNAETLLWNLCRGSGLTGVCGIRPVSHLTEVGGCVYIRPLLCMTREEIERFLKERGQTYCTDETNAETEYTRNRLRHLVLPVLEREVNTQSVKHMNETMRQMLEVREYMESQARAALPECVAWEPEGHCLIYEEHFGSYPHVLQTFMLRECIGSMQGNLANLGQVHIEEVLGLFGRQVGRGIHLPKGMTARRVYEGVELCAETAVAGVLAVPINLSGETWLPEWGIMVRCKVFEKTFSFSMKEIPEKLYTKWFDYGIIKKGVSIRGREPGDFITIDRFGHTKKLKSWFINEKIPACERAGIPLLACGNDILWIIGHRMSSAYQVREQTRHILQVEVLSS